MHQATEASKKVFAPRFQASQNVAQTPASQTAAIRRHLEAGNSLTAIDALNLFGCFRLAARIHDLTGVGLSISSKAITVGGKRVAEYSIGGVAT